MNQIIPNVIFFVLGGTKLFLSFECSHRLCQNLIASNAVYQIFASNFYPYLGGAGIRERIMATKMIEQKIYIVQMHFAR